MKGRYVEMFARGARAVADGHHEKVYKPEPKDISSTGPIAGITEVYVTTGGEVVVKIEGRSCCKRFAAQLFMKDVDFAATCTGEGGRYTFNSTYHAAVKMLMETMTHLNYHFNKSELSRV